MRGLPTSTRSLRSVLATVHRSRITALVAEMRPWRKSVGRFTGNCPVCRAGKLMKRKLDPDKCPICRNGQLGKQKRERPLIFCPICRTKPLKEEARKRLAILTETWWVCTIARQNSILVC